jgi:predicted TIM-barrel fold metal-dependent hydrolase
VSLVDIPIIDTDSHVTEPPNLWTSRLPARYQDEAPRVAWDDETSEHRWVIGDEVVSPAAFFATAGWKEYLPSYPPSLDDADPGSYDPAVRLKRLDEYGIRAQVLYPNLLAFFTAAFIRKDPALGVECVRAYNDFLVEFASADPARLIPLMMLPFWDVEASVAEMHRARDIGHKGVLFSPFFEKAGLPNIEHERWAPVLDTAQDLDLSVNFHIGFAATTTEQLKTLKQVKHVPRAMLAEVCVLGFLSNAQAITTLTLKGVCHRYPRLKFVSVESGFGYLPFVLQALDWQFDNSGVFLDHPEWMKPSEYFFRQIYGTFWFETVEPAQVEAFADNLMFETDYPHPTSLSPGPNSSSLPPLGMVERNLAGVRPEVARKILHDNAAAVYHLG